MKGPLPAWDRNVHYVMSQNLFQNSHEKLVSCGNQFDILNNKARSHAAPSVRLRWPQSVHFKQSCWASCSHAHHAPKQPLEATRS